MYGRYYESTFTGSMVGSGADVFAIWGYIIAHTKPDSCVELNPKILAMLIGMPEPNVIKAIDFLCQPDPKSRSKDKGGRRLVKVGEYLYEVVNRRRYYEIGSENERRQYMREYMRDYRKSKESKQVNSLHKQPLAYEDVNEDKNKGGNNVNTPPILSLSEQIKKDRSFAKCCYLCGRSSLSDSGRFVWRERRPFCELRHYTEWVTKGKPEPA